MSNPVVLITGGAKRIGAEIVHHLHTNNFNIVLHYRNSKSEAENIARELNSLRKNSIVTFAADLSDLSALQQLAKNTIAHWGQLDVLINNASSFYPTPIENATDKDWDALMASNLKAPFFLAQALAAELTKQQGCIINIADIYAERPLKEHTIYCIAKAGNNMLTKSLAQELSPYVRVNAIAPGAILWPEQNETDQEKILAKIPLKKCGNASDIAKTVLFLIKDAPYINGQIIAVDGGRTLTI